MQLSAAEKRDWIQKDISTALWKAFIAGMDGDTLVDRFDTSFAHTYPIRARFFLRLAELVQRDVDNRTLVRELIERIEATADELPPRKRKSADGSVSELALLLGVDEQMDIAVRLVMHTRGSRRRSGYKIFKQNRGHGRGAILVEAFERYGDQNALVTMLVTGENIFTLPGQERVRIAALSERFHQALAFEQLIQDNEPMARSMAEEFPMAYVWAAGRLRETRALDFVRSLLWQALDDAEAASDVRTFINARHDLGIYVWALGRLSAFDDLRTLRDRYSIVIPSYS